MMSQPTGIRILKNTAPTTGRAAKIQSASRRTRRLPEHGEQKICEDKLLTRKSPKPSVMEVWFASHVADAEKQRQSLITKITINRLKLSGFANPAINKDTRKFYAAAI